MTPTRYAPLLSLLLAWALPVGALDLGRKPQGGPELLSADQAFQLVSATRDGDGVSETITLEERQTQLALALCRRREQLTELLELDVQQARGAFAGRQQRTLSTAARVALSPSGSRARPG